MASSTRGTPKRRATSAWCGVATVMPQAPAASWAAKRPGAIVVLPCGANSTPWRAQYAAIVAMLASMAERRATITGQVNGPSKSRCPAATNAPSSTSPAGSHAPLSDQSILEI